MADEEAHVTAAVNDVEYMNQVGDDAHRGLYTYIVHPGDCTASDYQHWKFYDNVGESTRFFNYLMALADGTSLITLLPF